MPRGGHGRDQVSDGGSRGGVQQSWKHVLLRRGRAPALPLPAHAPRQRSRSPPARRRSRETVGRRQSDRRTPVVTRHPTQRRRSRPLPPPSARRASSEVDGGDSNGKDPVEDFFRTTKKPSLASVIVDGLAADVQAAIEAVVAAPLEFDEAPLLKATGKAVQLDAFSPTLCASTSNFGQFSRATPSTAHTMEAADCQLSSCTAIGAPPKSWAISAPTRHSARQAANTSIVPVAQHASLRIVKELGLLGPREKMTAQVFKALLHRFDEPLTDSDIAVIAKITLLDGEALRVMARMAVPDGDAEEAVV
ncbi:Histidyl-tRNA synthetase [Hordeum vulgare]|nr:Histidyl-tRNA synthetase [Hordeum vulgare]